jgi:hypothetical protein
MHLCGGSRRAVVRQRVFLPANLNSRYYRHGPIILYLVRQQVCSRRGCVFGGHGLVITPKVRYWRERNR